jgi:hypothetical protein
VRLLADAASSRLARVDARVSARRASRRRTSKTRSFAAPGYNPDMDINGDGVVDVADVVAASKL